jgi:hypothetical protein
MGNPELRPQTNYSANLSYILKSRYTFTLMYYYSHNGIVMDGYMSPDELVMITQPRNIERFNELVMLSASIPVQVTKWWRMQFEVMGMFRRCKTDDWHGIKYDTRGFEAQSSLQNYFTISKQRPQIELRLSAYACTATVFSIYEYLPRWGMSAGAEWTFFRKQFVLAFRCNDIFQSGSAGVRSVLAGQERYMKGAFYTRNFSTSLTWKFGNYTGTRIRTGMDSRTQ